MVQAGEGGRWENEFGFAATEIPEAEFSDIRLSDQEFGEGCVDSDCSC